VKNDEINKLAFVEMNATKRYFLRATRKNASKLWLLCEMEPKLAVMLGKGEEIGETADLRVLANGK
jgi:hypothetical protein